MPGRAGKSLYASRQLGVVDTNLFELGHHQDGKTRGLWCAFVEKEGHLLCVIDSEGLADTLKRSRVSVVVGVPSFISELSTGSRPELWLRNAMKAKQSNAEG
jgi:hypothetical protein